MARRNISEGSMYIGYQKVLILTMKEWNKLSTKEPTFALYGNHHTQVEVDYPHSKNGQRWLRAPCATSNIPYRPPYNPGSVLAELDHPIGECLMNFAAEPHQFRAE